MKNSSLYYSVGPLLYCPANNDSIVHSILETRFGTGYSVALCLEDTIADDAVEDAEQHLIRNLTCLYEKQQQADFFMPKIFVRVRSHNQIPYLYKSLGKAAALLTGFIAPKFSLETVDAYIDEIKLLNESSSNPVYIMPIFENGALVNMLERYTMLYQIKEKLDTIEPLVLNIRVGGNDLCHVFGFRRAATQSIHDIHPIASIFSDIVTVFGVDYVISGPVWEYYNGANWETGLRNELEADRLSGFVGKTVIHPNQIAVVKEAYMVSRQDYEDAAAILNWDKSSNSLVSGSTGKERMNEYKTHSNWALKILCLAEIYGVK